MSEKKLTDSIDKLLPQDEVKALRTHAQMAYGYTTDEQIIRQLDYMIQKTEENLNNTGYFLQVWGDRSEEVKDEYTKGFTSLVQLKKALRR